MSGVRIPLRPCGSMLGMRFGGPSLTCRGRSFNVLEVTTVKAPYRSALSAAGFAAAFAVSAIPSVASAQRQQGPGPDTKRVLVTAFRGDVEGGVRTADETRGRIASEFNIRTLMPTSKKDIDNTLLQSGYKPDSALS